MPIIEENKLRKHIDSGELHSLYVLYGKEKLLLKRSATRLINKSKGSAFPEFNFNEFTNDASVDDIADAALNLPFMAEQKCVVVSDFNVDGKNASEINKLNELLGSLSESTVLIFTYPTLEFDGKKSAKWRNFLKSAEKAGAVISFEPKERAELVKYLCSEAEKYDSSITKYNAEKITEYVGNDLTRLTNEIHKIASYCNGREITVEDIEKLVSKNVESRVFELSKAIIGGNYDRAYMLLDQLFFMKEKPAIIFATLSKNYVDIYRVRSALNSGLKSDAPVSYDPSYKGKEFVLRNAERDANSLSTDVLRRSLKVLLETDMLLKGSKTDNRQLITATYSQ